MQTARTPTGSELGELIGERGLEDAGELIKLAADSALAQVLDQDLWRAPAPGEAEEFDERRFAQWLEVLGDDDPAAAAGRLAAMDARAFLKLAEVQEVGNDPITREHLGRLVERPATAPSTALSDGGLRAALAALTDELRAARQRELAFLANVLVSAGDGGRALQPVEAAELAFEVCALGFRRGGGDLSATGLVRFFGRGWRERRPSIGEHDDGRARARQRHGRRRP